MEKKVKKEIIKMLLKQDLENVDENELVDLLFEQPISIDVDKEANKDLKFGDKLADKLTAVAGSWKFITIFTLFIIGWIILNICVFKKVDPYPFILLNLLLSCIAALQAPIIMMSQNREAKKDSIRNQNDYRTDLKSALILEELHDYMKIIIYNQKKILKELEKDNEN